MSNDRITFVPTQRVQRFIDGLQARQRTSQLNDLLERGLQENTEIIGLKRRLGELQSKLSALTAACRACHGQGTYSARSITVQTEGVTVIRVAVYCDCAAGNLALTQKLSSTHDCTQPAIAILAPPASDWRTAMKSLKTFGLPIDQVFWIKRSHANEWIACNENNKAEAIVLPIDSREQMEIAVRTLQQVKIAWTFLFGINEFPCRKYIDVLESEFLLVLEKRTPA